ncbi:multicopper oxidase domain-containing protein [Hymenobacter humi]|uniref:Multicopper oxidase domain-containing protein n=1 Tax=Hymenobacter humi TaxID=1411620 RepID=A0ABW2UC56_9BACT
MLPVEPRQYRFRLLNGSDSRFYHLKLTEGLSMWQIASDNGLLPQPVEQELLLLAPGERKEVIIDFSNSALSGKTIIFTNDANTPYPDGDPVDADDSQAQIMAFRVELPLNRDYPLTPVPASFHKPLPAVASATNVRKLILVEGEDEHGRLLPMLGTLDGGPMRHEDPITETPALNSTEIWEIYNFTPDAHPIHLHLVSFRVLSSQDMTGTVNHETGEVSNVQLQGQLLPPEPGQAGKKDTYPVAPGQMTRLLATFDRAGLYAWHCHILSHEDHDMMRPYFVGSPQVTQSGHSQVGDASGPAWRNSPFQIYPNPFTRFANLQLNVAEASAVAVRLFDLSGRLVRQLPARQLPAGQHLLPIDGTNLQSGMYLCELQVGPQFYRRRIVVAQ